MESRLIYESDKTYSVKIEWEKLGESEWRFLDKEPSEKSLNNILEYVNDNVVFVVRGLNDSRRIEKTELAKTIKALHGQENFKIWTKNLRRSVEFNKNGIYRRGELGENKIELFLARLLKFFVGLG